jgi:hypothetical protein
MLDWLRYRVRLAQLQKRKKQAVRLSLAKWDHLFKNSPEDSRISLVIDRSDIEPFEEDIENLIYWYLSVQAQKLRLLLPESSDSWQWSKHRGHFMLKPAEVQKLRSAIRAERKERSELAFRWLTGITGLIGVLIGLLAIILGKR